MEAKAIAKGLRVQPRKARLVMNLVRGKSVSDASNVLKNLNNKSSRLIEKVLVSAVANAENNHDLDVSKLFVSKAIVNEGPTMKRFKCGSRGHADPIKKRSSHITIEVSERN